MTSKTRHAGLETRRERSKREEKLMQEREKRKKRMPGVLCFEQERGAGTDCTSGGLGLAKNVMSSLSAFTGEGRVHGHTRRLVGICGHGRFWKSSLICFYFMRK